jgi:hypothetical protein
MDRLYKKFSKGELLTRQLPEIYIIIQLGHHFIGNVQKDFRGEAFIFLLR